MIKGGGDIQEYKTQHQLGKRDSARKYITEYRDGRTVVMASGCLVISCLLQSA